jgi:hypothetical protein
MLRAKPLLMQLTGVTWGDEGYSNILVMREIQSQTCTQGGHLKMEDECCYSSRMEASREQDRSEQTPS